MLKKADRERLNQIILKSEKTLGPDPNKAQFINEELKYCICRNVYYGDMIQCDNFFCKDVWFHFKCVGLKKAPEKDTKWFCKDC